MCKICRCSPEEHDIATPDKEHERRVGNLFQTDDSEESKTKYRIQKMTVKRTKFLADPAAPSGGDENNHNHHGDANHHNNSTGQQSQSQSPSSDITFEWVPQGTDEDTVIMMMRTGNAFNGG